MYSIVTPCVCVCVCVCVEGGGGLLENKSAAHECVALSLSERHGQWGCNTFTLSVRVAALNHQHSQSFKWMKQ